MILLGFFFLHFRIALLFFFFFFIQQNLDEVTFLPEYWGLAYTSKMVALYSSL